MTTALTPRRQRASRALTGVVLFSLTATGVAACGSAQKTACGQLEKTVTDLASSAKAQASDPAALEKSYRAAATAIRGSAAVAGGDVKDAANQTADALEKLASDFEAYVQNPGSAKLPDTTALSSAGQALEDACNS